MEEIEHIKKIEDEVASHVEKARTKAEKKVSDAYMLREKTVQEKKTEANILIEKQIKKVTEDAEKEAVVVRKGIDSETGKIESEAGKNMTAAVELIVTEFKNIK